MKGENLVLPGALLHAGLLLFPVVACGQGVRCLADPAIVAFLVLATLLYAADAVKDLRRGGGVACLHARGPCTHGPPRVGMSVGPWDAGHTWDAALDRLALLTGLAILTVFWVALAARANHPSPATGWQQAAGAAAMLAGIVLRGLAVSRLGRFFITPIRVTADQPLVCDGVYRLLRHPSETGTLAAALGAALLLGSWAAAVVWAAVILPLVVLRVRCEDRILRRAFGKPYLRYQRRTGGLLPRLPGRG